MKSVGYVVNTRYIYSVHWYGAQNCSKEIKGPWYQSKRNSLQYNQHLSYIVLCGERAKVIFVKRNPGNSLDARVNSIPYNCDSILCLIKKKKS
jgi:hypothetical protein